MERMMEIQEVILKAMAGKLKWWEAAEIIGVTDRTMRRWREGYQEQTTIDASRGRWAISRRLGNAGAGIVRFFPTLSATGEPEHPRHLFKAKVR
jgi:hypothetical protein